MVTFGAVWPSLSSYSERVARSFLILLAERGMEQAPSAPSPPPKPVHHEPISFGIDQILGAGTEAESERAPGRQSGSDLGGGDVFYSLGNPTGASAPSYTALSISLSGIMPPVEASGSYGESRSLSSRGVIRVPAHRPVAAPGPPTPVQSAVPGFGGLCFPWIGNRFAKDRISGRPAAKLAPLINYLWYYKPKISASHHKTRHTESFYYYYYQPSEYLKNKRLHFF